MVPPPNPIPAFLSFGSAALSDRQEPLPPLRSALVETGTDKGDTRYAEAG